MKKTVTILAPLYNEEESLKFLYGRLANLAKQNTDYNFEFLLVNDGSRDRTMPMIEKLAKKDSKISYVNLSRNFGKEIAMIAGFDHAQGDALVVIDADLQDPPELIPKMIKLWEKGFDDVYARRRSRKGETWLKKKTSYWFYRILQKTTNIPIQIDTGDFRLLDKKCIEAIKQFRESERYAKGMFSWIGFNKKEILYDRDPRIAGKTKWRYSKLINYAIDGITSFTTAPLRIASLIGIIVSLIAFFYIIIVVTKALIWGDPVAGYPSLMSVILFLGGVQLMSLGIIGEYIGKIFNETKNRPLYFVQDLHKAKIETDNKSR